MRPPKISDREISDPKLLRERVNQLFEQQFKLLEQFSDLETKLGSAGSGSGGGLTEQERVLLRSLAVGSTDSQLPGQPAVAQEVQQLPPTSTAIPGTLVVFGNVMYRFDGATRTWVDIISTAAPANMMTTDTNQTPGAAVVKTWTAAQIFNGGINLNGSSITNGLAGTFAGTLAAASLSASGNSTLQALTVGGLLRISDRVEVSITGVSATPFNVGASNFFIFVDTSTIAITLNVPAAPDTGRWLIVIDDSGNAAANNVTISGNGNNVNGAASIALAANYAWAILFWNGTQWNALTQ